MSNPLFENIGSRKDKLIEEIGELLQAIGKGERFGWFNRNPLKDSPTNFENMLMEWEDVKKAAGQYFLEFKKKIKVKNEKENN